MPTELFVPDRIQRRRPELFAAEEAVCFERAKIVTRTFKQTEGEHWALRRAKALRAVFLEMPIILRDGELLVGQRAGRLGAGAVYPEYHLHGLSRETTPPEVWDSWHGRTLGDEVRLAHPQRLRLAESEGAAGGAPGPIAGMGM
jgi:hypothetical protein